MYSDDDIDAGRVKQTKVVTKGAVNLSNDEIQRKRVEALQVGIEKLKNMKKEMEDERIREEIALNERLKNDV